MSTAYFIGTSITAGADGFGGGTPNAYPIAMCARMGWVGTYDGVGASGYIAAPTFASRLATIIAAHPDVVVVEGGANDTAAYPDLSATIAAMESFLADLRSGLPDALIYVTASQQTYQELVDAIVAFCGVIGAVFVDWRPWLTASNAPAYVSSAPHLTVAGYRYAGTRFAFAIRPPATGLA